MKLRPIISVADVVQEPSARFALRGSVTRLTKER